MTETNPRFATPQAAAMDGFPQEHCRVAASFIEGDEAYVVLDTGPAGAPHLYGCAVTRGEQGNWQESASSNGPASGWTSTLKRPGYGIAYVYGEAPAGADRVRAVLGDEVREAEVEGGIYLVAWGGVEEGEAFPGVVGFRVRGVWRELG
jgi:hypothetical protein